MYGKLIILLLACLLPGAVSAQPSDCPVGGWRRADPQEHGYDAVRFERIRRYVTDSLHTTGLMVVVGGDVIFEYGHTSRLSYIASCRKSVLAMLMGKYVENGTVDLDATLEQLGVDDIGGLLPVERRATLRDLVTSRSGVYHDASNGGDDADSRPPRGSKTPGSYYLYNNWDFNAAGALFEQLTGRSIYEIFRDDIAVPVGMEDFDMEAQRKSGDLARSHYPAYHMLLSTRDMARLGLLMLRKGRWLDRRVISEEWVSRIVSVVTPLEQMNPPSRRDIFEYGYMWWLFRVDIPGFRGAYTARGSMGQYITVLPELDMVVAHKTDSVYGRKTPWSDYYRLLRMIAEARSERNPA